MAQGTVRLQRQETVYKHFISNVATIKANSGYSSHSTFTFETTLGCLEDHLQNFHQYKYPISST